MQIEPISFFDEKEEVFNPKKEDFDINQNCLIHIIQERRERFPESIRSQSDSKIAGQIMNAALRLIIPSETIYIFAQDRPAKAPQALFS